MRKLIVLFTAVFLLLLALDALPFLRGGAGWQWSYVLPTDWQPVAVLAALLGVYLLGVWALRRFSADETSSKQTRAVESEARTSLRTWNLELGTWFKNNPVTLTLLWSVIGGAALGYAVVGVRGDAAFLLFTHTVAPVQTGYSTTAVQTMARDGVDTTLRRWQDVMRAARAANLIHLTTSPPGQVLVHYWAAQALEGLPPAWSMALRTFQCSDAGVMLYTRGELLGAALVGMLMPLWSALTCVPLYFAARILTTEAQRTQRNINKSTETENSELTTHNQKLGTWNLELRTHHSELNPENLERGTRNSELSETSALRIAQWWALIPSALLFLPTWNTFYPFLVTSAFALLAYGLQ
jgi:hypothetical protein